MADLFKKMRDIEDELRPNLKDLEKEVKEPEPEPVAKEPVVEVTEVPLSSEEKAELDNDELEVFEGRNQGELVNRNNVPEGTNWDNRFSRPRRSGNSVNNNVPDIDNELSKIKTILQGATNNNVEVGQTIPWDLVLSKIETIDEKSSLRYGANSLLSAAAMFGKESKLAAYLWEELKIEMGLSRANQGFTTKMINTTITQSFVDKNVQTFRKNTGKDGMLNSLQPSGSPYG